MIRQARGDKPLQRPQRRPERFVRLPLVLQLVDEDLRTAIIVEPSQGLDARLQLSNQGFVFLPRTALGLSVLLSLPRPVFRGFVGLCRSRGLHGITDSCRQ